MYIHVCMSFHYDYLLFQQFANLNSSCACIISSATQRDESYKDTRIESSKATAKTFYACRVSLALPTLLIQWQSEWPTRGSQ